MKKLPNLLKALLLGAVFFCFMQSNKAQCAKNQYLKEFKVGKEQLTSQLIAAGNRTTVFNRIDFVFSGLNGLLTGQPLKFPIRVDFFNNQQFVVLKENELKTIQYPNAGVRRITVMDAVGFRGTFDITIRSLTNQNPYQAPDAVWDISNGIYTPTCNGCPPDVNGGLAKAYIKYANPDKKLRKVLVFVEGIDFDRDSITDPDNGCKAIRYGDFGWDVFYMGHKADTSWDFVKLMPATRQAINQKGYDLILIDFRNGADYMQANGELLIKLLKRIKTERQPDTEGILHPISVIGASMGGQVAKYALTKLEKENPNDYCVNNFIAFDSPNKGANIPLSLQAMAYFTEQTDPTQNLWSQSLMRPAARQLLVFHLKNSGSKLDVSGWVDKQVVAGGVKVDFDNNNTRDVWLAELNSLGNYPKKTRNTAIACGNMNAVSLGFKPTDEMFHASVSSSNYNFGNVMQLHLFSYGKGSIAQTNVNSLWKIQTSGRQDSLLFLGAIPDLDQHGIFGSPKYYWDMMIKPKSGVTFAHWDNAPGCKRRDFVGIADLITQTQTDPSKGTTVNINANVEEFTFMPTVSCLDINWPMDNTHIFKNIFNSNILLNKLTPFEAFYAPPTANLRHVEITTPMKDSLIQWITENERDLASLPNAKGVAYNFGYARRWIPSVSINSGGTLRINQLGATSYGAGRASYENTWETYLYDCGGSTVNIEEGGKFIIGSDTDSKKGIVHIPAGSVLNNIQGALKLQKNSEIIIEKGGVMNLKGGISDLHQASKITVQKDAILNITGGTLSIRDASQIIVQSGGKVIITGGLSSLLATSQLVVEQGGIVEVKTDAVVAITEQSIFDVRGGKATFQDRSSTTISGKARLETTGEVRFNTGQLTMRDEGLIQANNQSLLVFNSEMHIQMNHFAAIDVVQKATLRFDGSAFATVRFRGGSDTTENTPIRLRGCKWIINAPMAVSGSVYFQVINDPSITYLNNLGFNLKGDGKRLNTPFRVLELMGVDFDIVNANIQHGKIIYQDHSSLGYKGGSFFTDVYFEGGNPDGQGVAAIINNNDIADALNISNCLFDNVDHCVKIQAHPTLISGDINIVSTTATRFKSLGFDFLLNGNINIMHSHFIASEAASDLATSGGSHFAPALRVRDMGGLRKTIVSNTIIESTVDWQHYPQWAATSFDPKHDYSYIKNDPIYPPQNDMMQAIEDSYLVGLFNVVDFQLNNASEVRGGYIGILTDMGEADGSPIQNNVSISCSSVHDNYTGIVMINIKDPTSWGSVVLGGLYLDAATIDDNVFGIYGRNIFIDANLTATRLPNTFGILNGTGRGHYMCIHYSTTTAPNGPLSGGALLAPNNFWSSGAPVMNVNYLLNGSSINAAPAAAMSSDCVPNERHSTDPTATMASATDEQKAFITVNGVTKALLPLYWKGISEYLNSDITDARATLSEITAIPINLILASDNPYLRSYHTLAWAIAPGPAVSDIGNQKIANIKNSNPMFVFPNPAEGFFKLVLPSGRYDVQLSDVLGRVIKQIQVADYEEISTENIQSGLYQITVRKKGEQAIFQTGKIVVKE